MGGRVSDQGGFRLKEWTKKPAAGHPATGEGLTLGQGFDHGLASVGMFPSGNGIHM